MMMRLEYRKIILAVHLCMQLQWIYDMILLNEDARSTTLFFPCLSVTFWHLSKRWHWQTRCFSLQLPIRDGSIRHLWWSSGSNQVLFATAVVGVILQQSTDLTYLINAGTNQFPIMDFHQENGKDASCLYL